MFTGLVGRVRGWTLGIKIEMLVVDRGLQGIVEVRGAMPDTVGFIDRDMVHLNGEIDIKRWLP